MSKDLNKVGIDMLNISTRPYNVIKRAGYKTVGELAGMTYSQISEIRNLGTKSFFELLNGLAEYGVYPQNTKKDKFAMKSRFKAPNLTSQQNFINELLKGVCFEHPVTDDMLIVHPDFDMSFSYLENNVLTVNESKAIRLHIFENKTLSDTAEILGVSSERVRQILICGFRKARHYADLFTKGYYIAMEDRKKRENAVRELKISASNIPLQDLELSTRTYNTLWRAGYKTAGDFVGMDINQLLSIRNLGGKSLDELICSLARLGIQLR